MDEPIDQTAFLAAVESSRAFIGKIASLYSQNSDERDDLVQEIWYQLWKSYPGFEGRSATSTWIYRVALNVAIYHLKKKKRRIHTVSMDALPDRIAELADPTEEEKWELLKQHVAQLNLFDQGLLILYLENKSYQEIAAITGISESNVGTKLSRIREKLKQQIFKSTNHGTR
ncbi:MAG TPA: RNA polymerase sigma factor [Ferruginibacter sp.]|nr:RNA polymerase sigma factor [Ferruginibacter sp.]